ncbi:MAG: hypothetical protein Q4D21_08050 [Phascolarctobacterium sp.]|nr:hypothetical protein [Phascolarctobacterium sp.]
MKKVLGLALLLTSMSCVALANDMAFSPLENASAILMPKQEIALASKINSAGYYKNIRLWGRVKVVKNFADIRVQVVNSFPDLKVKRVTNFPDSLGKWQYVENFPDFTIQYVDSFPDIKIKFVDSFPGLP